MIWFGTRAAMQAQAERMERMARREMLQKAEQEAEPNSERTYTLHWERRDCPEDGVLACSGLTPRVMVARIRTAARLSGPIIVHAIKPERRPAKRAKTS